LIRRAIPRGTLEPAKMRMQAFRVNSGVPHKTRHPEQFTATITFLFSADTRIYFFSQENFLL
jgi:hypothetical protein